MGFRFPQDRCVTLALNDFHRRIRVGVQHALASRLTQNVGMFTAQNENGPVGQSIVQWPEIRHGCRVFQIVQLPCQLRIIVKDIPSIVARGELSGKLLPMRIVKTWKLWSKGRRHHVGNVGESRMLHIVTK